LSPHPLSALWLRNAAGVKTGGLVAQAARQGDHGSGAEEGGLMKLSENVQELLEQLWVVVYEENQPGLPVNDTLPEGADELLRLNLAQREGDRLVLTAEGQPEAAQAIRRHRLAERLLADVLTTEQDQMEDHACRLEHALVEGLDDSICTLLGHPPFCPHGKPIPQGACCRQMLAMVPRLIAPLRELQADQSGQIAYIQMNDPKRLQKLMAMGVLPGASIRLLRRFPSFVFEAGYSQFAVDEEIASDIFVRLH
jgi:DtxR family transcriptional regulator, Mn-dependent transcriptional regulator